MIHSNRFKLFALMVAICLVISFGAPQSQSRITPLNDEKAYGVSFEYDPLLCPVPVVQVRINNSKPLKFILDTGGYWPLILHRRSAINITLPVSEKPIVTSPITLYRAAVDKIELITTSKDSPLSLSLSNIYVSDLSTLSELFSIGPIDGILGAPVLSPTTARLDFSSKTLSIYLQPNSPVRTENCIVIPMTKLDTRFTIPVQACKSPETDALIDTGSADCVLPRKLIESCHDISKARGYSWTVGGPIQDDVFLVPTVRLGSSSSTEVIIRSHEKGDQMAVVGMSILERFRVTLDFRNKEMILEPVKGYTPRSRLPGLNVLQIEQREGQFVVGDIARDSLPIKAGAKRGDKILSVDNIAVSGIPGSPLQNLIDGFANTKAKLVLERAASEVITIEYLRPSIFTNSR